MNAVLWLIHQLISLVFIVVIVNAVLSWLIAFEIVSRGNRIVHTLWDFTNRLTAPMLAPLRRVIPPVGGVDLSPLVLLLGLGFVQQLIPMAV